MAHETFDRQDRPQGSSDRSFGLVFAGFFLILAVLGYFGRLPFSLDSAYLASCPYLAEHPELAVHATALALLATSMVFLLLALAAPKILSPLNWVWTRFGLILHRVVSPLVLGAMFFLVFTPVGVVMRLLRVDPLRLRFDAELPSYWIVRSPPGPAPDSLKDQF